MGFAYEEKPLDEFLEWVKECPTPVLIRIGDQHDLLTQAVDSTILWTISSYQLTLRAIAIEYEDRPDIASHFSAQPQTPLVLCLWKGVVVLAFETEHGIPPNVATLLRHLCETIQDYPEILCGTIRFAADYIEIQGDEGRDAILVIEDKDEIASRDEFALLADNMRVILLGKWRDEDHFEVKFISSGKFS